MRKKAKINNISAKRATNISFFSIKLRYSLNNSQEIFQKPISTHTLWNALNVVTLSLLKRKNIIRKKIPNHYHAYCKNFGKIEIHFPFFVQDINYRVVKPQSNNRHEDKRKIFTRYLRIRALKCPNSI